MFSVFNSFVFCFPFTFFSFYVIPNRFLTLLTVQIICILLIVQFCKFKFYQNSGSIRDDRHLESPSGCHFITSLLLCCCLQPDAPTWIMCNSVRMGEILLFIFSGNAAQHGLWPPRSRGFLITHNDAPQSVGLLWTCDQPVAETPT
jgi:hypothetical protein